MGIIHLNPAPKRFTMPYSIFFANIRYTHLSRQVVLYCLPLLLGAIYTVFMWQKCIYSIHLIVSHPLNHCCLIYPAPPCRLAHTDLPTEIFSYNLDFFFCSYLFLPGHDNTPPMMTVFYFTVSHRGSISTIGRPHLFFIQALLNDQWCNKSTEKTYPKRNYPISLGITLNFDSSTGCFPGPVHPLLLDQYAFAHIIR